MRLPQGNADGYRVSGLSNNLFYLRCFRALKLTNRTEKILRSLVNSLLKTDTVRTSTFRVREVSLRLPKESLQ